MTGSYKDNNLYNESLGSYEDDRWAEPRGRLASALDLFRSKAEQLAAEIPRHVPFLTDHSVRHLDALWRLAGDIVGPKFRLTPTEAFVFGGAVLLHDLGNAVAAYENGLGSLKGPEWDDLVYALLDEKEGREPTVDELSNPPEDVFQMVVLQRLRQLHADAAVRLATKGFFERYDSSAPIFLIENDGLRDSLGSLIGRIASSHHWDLSKVNAQLGRPQGTPPDLPSEWSIDPLTIACLLRVADAAHLDSGRAPKFTRVLRNPRGLSKRHWDFQGRLLRPSPYHNEFVYSSRAPFPMDEREGWWLGYDTLKLVDAELRSVDVLMRRERPERRFTIRGVTGVESPGSMKEHVQVEGWEPIDIRLKISDVLGVIDKFGGEKLYGDNPQAALRELIANSADAVRARRIAEGRESTWGAISVRIGNDASGDWLEVEDDGIGMSEEVLRGPLLDFGNSFWRSDLARDEHPGLLSRGFKPTGQFGIGFFSVFMLGDRVRVITRAVGRAHESTTVLEIQKSEAARPLIRLADLSDPQERLLDGGTRVRVWLKKNPFEGGGLFGVSWARRSRTPHGGDESREAANFEHFCGTVAALAPALDVRLRCQVEGNLSLSEVVVHPNDWMEMAFEALVERLSFGKARAGSQVWKETGIQEDFLVDGVLVGRVGICSSAYRVFASGTLVVGGLSAKTNYSGFDGIILAESPTLNRMQAIPRLSGDDLRSLLKFLDQLDGRAFSWDETLHLAQLFLNLGGIAPLHCFICGNDYRSFRGLQEWLGNVGPGGELLLVPHDVFPVAVGLGAQVDVSLADVADEGGFDDNVVIVGDTRSGEILPGLPQGPLKGVGHEGASPPSLVRKVVEEVAKAWGCQVEQLLDSAFEELRPVGTYYAEHESVEVRLDCIVLERPAL